jgi:hypothetical protein
MESLVKEVDGQKFCNGEDTEYLSEGGGNETEEPMPPPGADVYSFVGKQGEVLIHEPGPKRNGEIIRHIFYKIKNDDQTRGSQFFIGFARAWGRTKAEIELVLKQWAGSTLKNYIHAWNTFFDFLGEHDDWLDCFNSSQQIKALYINYVIWLMEISKDGEHKNASKGSFRLCKSGVASVINTITDIDVAKDKWNKAVTMSFLRQNPVTPKHWYMWSVGDLFKYFKEFDEGVFQSSSDPEWEIFLWQQRKTAVLIMLFGFLRPGELTQVSANKWEKIDNQGIFVEVEIKVIWEKSQRFLSLIFEMYLLIRYTTWKHWWLAP